jgi:hypothetical protein
LLLARPMRERSAGSASNVTLRSPRVFAERSGALYKIGIGIVLGLTSSLLAPRADAQAAQLSNDQMAGFSIVIGSPRESQETTYKIVPVATADLSPIPLAPAPKPPPHAAKPQLAVVKPQIVVVKPRTAAVKPQIAAAKPQLVAAKTIVAAGPVAQAGGSERATDGAAPARKLHLHIRPSTDLTISSGTIEDARINSVGDEVVLHVDGNAVSIKAQGISGISFEP